MHNEDDKNISVPNELLALIANTLKQSSEANLNIINMVKADEKQRRIKMILIIIPIILLLAYSFYTQHKENSFETVNGYIAEVQINGVISKGADASADKLIPALKKAFEDKNAKGVVIKVNSPGGDPTQSILIYDAIVQFKENYDRPFTLIGEGSITSGSYWLALSADKIYALPSTYVGSIGVVMEALDVSKLAERYDVSKHIITAGINKRRMDLFKSPDENALIKYQSIADQMHDEFINIVKERRGDKLKGDEDLLFSGDFWLGREAMELGLVDEVSSTSKILNEIYETDTTLNYNTPPSFF